MANDRSKGYAMIRSDGRVNKLAYMRSKDVDPEKNLKRLKYRMNIKGMSLVEAVDDIIRKYGTKSNGNG